MEFITRGGSIRCIMTHLVRLADAIHQTRPFDSVAKEALLTLMWTTDRVSSVANQPLVDADLSPAQYNVLRILGGSPDGLQNHQVTERLLTRAPNLTRLVDKLESKGLIHRRRCSEDRRVVWLTITDGGKKLLQSLRPVMSETARAVGRGLDPAQMRQLIDLLTRLRGGVPETLEPAP